MVVNRQVIAGRTGGLMLPSAASGYRWRISGHSEISGIMRHFVRNIEFLYIKIDFLNQNSVMMTMNIQLN